MKVIKGTKIRQLAVPLFLTLTSVSALADITGIVYKDFDLNGEKNGGDTVVSGVKLTAVCTDGTNLETVTDANGTYRFSGFEEGSLCRIEADPSNAGLGSGPNAQGSSPLVDIVADGSTHDISTSSPATYCQANPDVIMAATPGWFTDDDDKRQKPDDFGTIFKIPSPQEGDFNDNGTIGDKRDVLKVSSETGAIWGAAWQKSTQTLFVSAVIKRYVPLNGESDDPAKSAGTIYKIEKDGTLSEFAVVENVITDADEDILKNRDYSEGEDKEVKELVGAKGLGDLDISEDEKYLYTINLNTKELVKIDANSGDIVETKAIPNPYGSACEDEMVRPWALKIRGNDVYIGSVCENEILEGDDPNDSEAGGLGATVQKFDGTEFSNVAQTNTLRYLRSRGYNPKDETNKDYQNTDWSHGSYEWLPQPMLTDIEFANNGDLVLGYTDRSIMIRERAGSHGDIRKMCLNADGSYTDESTDRVATDCESHKVEYKDNDEVYYEFYVGDYFNGYLGEDGHPETASGALAQAPGDDNIIVGMVDGTDWWQPGSIGLYSHTTGDKVAAQAVIDNRKTVNGGEQEPFAAKAGGMGDVELLCDPAPIELGNYVWLDLDEDGIQDPNEPPMSDVNVTLSCDDEEYGVATTDREGHYYFGGLNNVNLDDDKSIIAGLDCELSLKKADVNDKEASEQNPNGNDDDTIDNDAKADGDYNKFTFTTTASSDHSLDFGIVPARGCVTGKLYEDVNDNGEFDDGDNQAPAHISLMVTDLYGNSYNTETDDEGKFTIDGILAGEVEVAVDTTDTDIPDGSVWSDPGATVSVTLSEGNSDDDSCSAQDFLYTLPEEKDRDPKDVAICANPTSLTWEGSNKSTATVWHDLLDGDLNDIETASGNTVKVSMHIDNPDNQFYDTDSDNDSGSGTSAAFGEPYLTLYLGDQSDAGDGEWDSEGECDTHGYDLLSGEKSVLTVDFNESVVLDNWRIRDVDSGDVRSDTSNWEWQDGIEVVAYDANGEEVAIESKIGDSGAGLIKDDNGIVHTDKENYDAGDGDFITGDGTTPGATNGHIVLTSNFIPIQKLVITHTAGPDVPCQTRSALAMTGLAVCKPLHISGKVYDDKDGTDQARCSNNDDIDGEAITEVEGKPLYMCLLDRDDVVMESQLLGEDGSYDFSRNIRPNTHYGTLLTTAECVVGNKAPSGELADGWNYEGETYTNSPDGKLDGFVDIKIYGDTIEGIDYAINKTPTAQPYHREEELNPNGTTQVAYVAEDGLEGELVWDNEEGSDVTVTILGVTGGTLYYDGEEVGRDSNITNADFTLFSIDPLDGDVQTSFRYEVTDSACRVSDEALFDGKFTTIYISGNLFLDKERNGEVDGNATAKSCDGSTPLYANLIDSNNKVVFSKAIDESGHYAFYASEGVEIDTPYSVVLSTISGTVGEDAPEATLTQGCIHADGEVIGTEGTDGKADGIISVDVQEENVRNINFAITPTVKIGDHVWIENDNDGNASTGTITEVDDANVSLVCENGYKAETRTVNGRYSFELPVNMGSCKVYVETPQKSSPSEGSDDNAVPNSEAENDLTHDGINGTTVEVGERDNDSLDFGFATVGNLCGNVSEDTNNDDKGENPLSDVTLSLEDAQGNVVGSTQTDSEGNYCFNDIVAGEYTVVETQPEGFIDVTEVEGGADGDKGDNGRNNAISAYVEVGETDGGNDFVEEKPSHAYRIGTHFWIDNDHNGVYDANGTDVPIAGALIELYNGDREKLYWTDASHSDVTTQKTQWAVEVVTNEEGEYYFDVPAGRYQVHFNIPNTPAYEGYVFDEPLSNEDANANLNTVGSQGFSQVVEVGPNVNKTLDLTLDAGINCGCDNAPIQASGGSALGVMGLFGMVMMSLLSAFAFMRKEEV
jgi:hypothetical protein